MRQFRRNRERIQETRIFVFKMDKFKLLFLLIQLSFGFYFCTFQFSKEERVQQPSVAKTKTILIWNSVNRIETAYFNIGSSSFANEKCPVNKCQIFTQREALPFREYDAVLVNMLEVGTNLPEGAGYTRSIHQRFVFLQQESPRTSPLDLGIYLNYFNWTMTYKYNSDILLLYGKVKRKPSAPETGNEVKRFISETRYLNKNYATNKRKVLVWMASHCNTDGLRETYVEELRKYIDLDI